MLVKMLDGNYAGQIRDLRNDVALEHLKSGKVGHAFRDELPTPRGDDGPLVLTPPAEPELAAKKKKAAK